jgi:hypothetical protein
VATTTPLARHCERQRSNPDSLRKNLDCFVVVAPRNDEFGAPPLPLRGRNRAATSKNALAYDLK